MHSILILPLPFFLLLVFQEKFIVITVFTIECFELFIKFYPTFCSVFFGKVNYMNGKIFQYNAAECLECFIRRISFYIKLKLQVCLWFYLLHLDTSSTQRISFHYFWVDIRGELLLLLSLSFAALKNQEI